MFLFILGFGEMIDQFLLCIVNILAYKSDNESMVTIGIRTF
jgi:hypothetical protein